METLSLSDPTWLLRIRWYNEVWHRKSELKQYLLKQVQSSSSKFKQPQSSSIKFNQVQSTSSNLKQPQSSSFIPRIHFNKSLNNLLTQTHFLFLIRLLDQHIDIWESGSKYWCKAETKISKGYFFNYNFISVVPLKDHRLSYPPVPPGLPLLNEMI